MLNVDTFLCCIDNIRFNEIIIFHLSSFQLFRRSFNNFSGFILIEVLLYALIRLIEGHYIQMAKFA